MFWATQCLGKERRWAEVIQKTGFGSRESFRKLFLPAGQWPLLLLVCFGLYICQFAFLYFYIFFYCTCQFNFFVFVNLGRKKVKKAEKEAVIVPGQWPLSQHVTFTVCTTRIRCHFQLILRRIYYFSSIILVLILVILMPDDNVNNERYTFCTMGRRCNVQ